MMNILITGANGFIGKNLIAALLERRDIILLEVDKDTEEDRLISIAEKPILFSIWPESTDLKSNQIL